MINSDKIKSFYNSIRSKRNAGVDTGGRFTETKYYELIGILIFILSILTGGLWIYKTQNAKWHYINHNIVAVNDAYLSEVNIQWRVPTRYFGLDPQNNPVFAYYTKNEDLMVKHWSGRNWDPIEKIGETSNLPSLCIGKNGNIHVAWRQKELNDICYQRKAYKGTWLNNKENASETTEYSSACPCIDVDTQGRPHISWYDDEKAFRACAYKYRDIDNQWKTLGGNATLTGPSHYPTYLAVDSLNNPHIIYLYGGRPWPVGYQYWDGNSWQYLKQKEISVQGGSTYASLAVDSHNCPHIVYGNPPYLEEKLTWLHFPEYGTKQRFLYHTYYNGTDWKHEKINSIPQDIDEPMIAIDSKNHPHVVWAEKTDGNWDIFYSFYNGINWVKPINVSATSGDSFHPCIIIDKKDNPHIAWHDNTRGNWDIYYIRYNGYLILNPKSSLDTEKGKV